MLNRNISVNTAFTNASIINFTRGNKFYEYSNHLGNVLVTISDKKIGHDAGNGTIDYYNADVITANDYYSGGMTMPGRKYQAGSGSYHYSINGQEKESDLNENITSALYWEYDSRIVRRWNVDPLIKVPESPYLCFSVSPILINDVLGNEGTSTHTDKNGKVIAVFDDGDKGVYKHGDNADGKMSVWRRSVGKKSPYWRKSVGRVSELTNNRSMDSATAIRNSIFHQLNNTQYTGLSLAQECRKNK